MKFHQFVEKRGCCHELWKVFFIRSSSSLFPTFIPAVTLGRTTSSKQEILPPSWFFCLKNYLKIKSTWMYLLNQYTFQNIHQKGTAEESRKNGTIFYWLPCFDLHRILKMFTRLRPITLIKLSYESSVTF